VDTYSPSVHKTGAFDYRRSGVPPAGLTFAALQLSTLGHLPDATPGDRLVRPGKQALCLRRRADAEGPRVFVTNAMAGGAAAHSQITPPNLETMLEQQTKG
jgi:hypothetical protein